jgi:hypothetical protein
VREEKWRDVEKSGEKWRKREEKGAFSLKEN